MTRSVVPAMPCDVEQHLRRTSGTAGRRGGGLRAALAVVATTAAAVLSTLVATAAPAAALPVQPDLGPNVVVFDPAMPVAQIQAEVDAVAAEQVSNQFGDQRYALLFKPGTYGSAEHPLLFQVGYYTEVAGLGLSPTDVTIHGHVDVYNRCHPTAPGAPPDCTALDNFWRSLSNLSIHVTGGSGCQSSAEFWAVSQAAPMRRVEVTGGNVSLQDYCSPPPQYASGGFIADSAFSGGVVINGGQQQFLTRNSSIDTWTNGVWNQVFAGDVGAPPSAFPTPPYTTLAATPASREKPYLYLDAAGRYDVLVPSAGTATTGTTWQQGRTPGRSLPLRSFFVAHPSDSVAEINRRLSQGMNLLLTPGVYDVATSITVSRADTVVLGLGLATLTAQDGAVPMTVADVPGVDIAGLTLDAGADTSPRLLQIGSHHARRDAGYRRRTADPADPTGIQDVFFRVGGPHVGRARVSLEVNSDDVILDDVWAWRADHGTGVGWKVNRADEGVVVNGDDVTATGLFVEHYQKYDVVWNGEGGRTVFFQNEMPYDAPSQAAWQHDGTLGYAAYKVADSVRTHEVWGAGSYIFTDVDPTLHASDAFEVPTAPGVRLHDLLTVSLNGAGTIDHVVNGVGAAVTPTSAGPSTVVDYPGTGSPGPG